MPTLAEMKTGQKAIIERLDGNDAIVQRIYEMGVLEGEEIEILGFAPLGDPIEILVKGYRLSLRQQEAARIHVTPTPS
ncbi:MAG: ferrous iron transport protein A [Gemmataceae bacterium]